MNQIHILVIGRHPEILQTVIRLVNSNPEWKAIGCLTDNEAITAFNQQTIDLVLLGAGIEESSENKLCAHFKTHKPHIKIVQHYGGGSGLLNAEIHEALKQD